MIRVFIGYDSAEDVAFSVLAHSIHARASMPVATAPVMLSQLKPVFERSHNSLQSTEFSFSRFLTPYLAGYEGWALFMDCDMLMLDDIAELWKLRDERYAVQVVKHVHVPKEDVKFLGHTQTKYEKKNWSFELHQFKWLASEALIGELPSRWNHLSEYDPPRPDAALVHFTIGGPWFPEYRASEYAGQWFLEREAMLSASGKMNRK